MGKLIVFEGIDGSGKSTQFDLLCSRYVNEGLDFKRLRFPRYDKPSSALIKMYLGGDFGGDPDAVNAYAASAFYAVDRFASFIQDWRDYYDRGGLVLTDRYTTSNSIHQGAKMPPAQREQFFNWLYEFEFTYIGLPAPDLVIYLDIEAEQATRRLHIRQDETGTTGDIHEKDAKYLEHCALTGSLAAAHYGWHKIRCFDGVHERAADEIHHEIYTTLKQF